MDELPFVIAHRGESYLAPENSLSAINLAWAKKASAVEIDVHLSADNEIVVIHDKHTGRVGDSKLFIKKSTLKELKRIDIGIKKSTIFKGEKIPCLEDVLNTVPTFGKLIIEIKCGKEIIKPLVRLLNNSKLNKHQIEFIAYNYSLLSELKSILPLYKMLWLHDLDYFWPQCIRSINAQKLLKKMLRSNLDGVNVWAGKTINKNFVDAFKARGLKVYTWTVNDLQNAHRMIAFGVDAITTDRADWLKKQIKKKN